ncbi:MAG: hypothetical protein JWN38_283 [Candidatus Saccharibacteria bacterium]|nr:hypothetical protein [Candidatus Saccharibacteria bacterium]
MTEDFPEINPEQFDMAEASQIAKAGLGFVGSDLKADGQLESLRGSELVDGIIVERRPINMLPLASARSDETDLFWAQRKLRPDNIGGNFVSVPVLGLGITYEAATAVLRLPTTAHLNKVVDRFNPGGFQFNEVDGFLKTGEFLDHIGAKRFPLSQSTDRTSGVPDRYLDASLGSDKEWWYERRRFLKDSSISPDLTSLKEHDLVDHIGLALLPASSADNIAGLAKIATRDFSGSQAVAGLDVMLDMIASYALTPAVPHDAKQAEAKDAVWEMLQDQIVKTASTVFSGLDLAYPVPRLRTPDTPPRSEYVDWFHAHRKKELSDEAYRTMINERFGVDRQEFDQQIAKMQALTLDDASAA